MSGENSVDVDEVDELGVMAVEGAEFVVEIMFVVEAESVVEIRSIRM